MAAKSKTAVKLKPLIGRPDEKERFQPAGKKVAASDQKKINPLPAKRVTALEEKKTGHLFPTKKAAVPIENLPVKPVIPLTSPEFLRLIHGDFTQPFSKQASRHFRIFLSSTFSDFKIERNELYRRVFPSIKQACARFGYEFQVVDMRWGVSDTADCDHTADSMCMDEIERCMALSAGLNFIYLVGNRYGYLYVPTKIDAKEFETILQVAHQTNIVDVVLLEKWFQLDGNSLPPKYVYLPITAHFKHFEDRSIEYEQEKKQWQEEERRLLKALRDAVDKACERKLLSNEQAIKYFQSITEREIRQGTIEKNRANVIGILRDFTDPLVETALDAKFFDSSTNERIAHSMNKLKNFCTQVTLASQLKQFVVPWKSGGLKIDNEPSHAEYIDNFCTFLTRIILEMIEKTCRRAATISLSSFHEDLLHHGTFCREKTAVFFGRNELLANIRTRLDTTDSMHRPLALVAESGSGKTSIMARLAQELRVWYPSSAVLIRFLGTSAQSTTIESILRSICTQLKILYGMDAENETDEDDDSAMTFSSLVRIFHERLKSIFSHRKHGKSSHKSRPLFILLDAIDQLEHTSKYAFQFDSWLPRYLSRDVHILISFIPSIDRINLKELFANFVRNDETMMINIPRLYPIDCEAIIRTYLHSWNRQLTAEQNHYLLMTIEQNPKPLYLKLLLDIARTWTNFEDLTLRIVLTLPETIEDAVDQLFARLENRHGKQFVQFSLAYLVNSLNGISENELEDCLSITDVVLNEIFDHHDPPIPNAIHVPSLLCQSFLYSIKEYLSRKRIHEKHVLAFYHRKFFEATIRRYQHLRQKCHENLIELYCNDQVTLKRTIVLEKRNRKIMIDADRLVSAQMTNVLNRRKLIALPYHCLESEHRKDDILRSKCLLNLNFLSCQLRSLGHVAFLDSFRNYVRLRPNWFDLKQIYRAIWSMNDEDVTNTETDLLLILAEQILGFIDDKQTTELYNKQMNTNENVDLERLIVDCRDYCMGQPNSLRPCYAGFPQETGALAWSFSPVTHVLYVDKLHALIILDGEQQEENDHLIWTYSVAVINLQTSKVDKIELDETFDHIWAGYITKNGNKIYLFGEKYVRTYSCRTGDMLDERILSWDNKSYCNKAFCMTNNEEQLIIANERRVIALDEIDDDAIYRSGRIPTKTHPIDNQSNTNSTINLRCMGTNEEYILCLIFDDQNESILITLWSLHEHVEILPMRLALFYPGCSTIDLFDLILGDEQTLLLATVDGNLRTFDLLKLKPNTKLVSSLVDDAIHQWNILPEKEEEEEVEEEDKEEEEELTGLECFANDIVLISSTQSIMLFSRRDFSRILQKFNSIDSFFSWNMIDLENHCRTLITVDANQRLFCMYHLRENLSSTTDLIKIEFRSDVEYMKLLRTTTIMDEEDEKDKCYVLILLADQTVQLLDTNQLSQASLQPTGLFTRIRSYDVGIQRVIACEHGSDCPLVMASSDGQSMPTPQFVHALANKNIEHIATLNNDQYYVIITNDLILDIYSINQLDQSLLQLNLSNISQTSLFALRTYPSSILILLFLDRFCLKQLTYDPTQNRLNIIHEQMINIPNRNINYSLKFTPDKHFLILEQLQDPENDEYLKDFRLFICDDKFQLTPISGSITYVKSKSIKSSKITTFITYVALHTRNELWLANQGTILRVRLPSNIAELDIRADYHCWMRHSLALYEKTAEKQSLLVTITSLAIQTFNDACVASGGDDGSIILWHLTAKYSHDVLKTIHSDEITGLLFDPKTRRLYSSSLDRTLAIWSNNELDHVLKVHIPIDRIQLLSSHNILLACGKFWGFDRLMMFYIGNRPLPPSETKDKTNYLKDSVAMQACEMASWAL